MKPGDTVQRFARKNNHLFPSLGHRGDLPTVVHADRWDTGILVSRSEYCVYVRVGATVFACNPNDVREAPDANA